MRAVVAVALVALGGCSAGGSVADLKIANDAPVMLTARPSGEVAACIGQTLGVSAQPSGNGYEVASPNPGATYRVHPIDDPDHRFATEVDESGHPNMDGAAAAACLSPSSAA